MYGFGWHDVIQPSTLRDTYNIRNYNTTYSGMETKLVYTLGCTLMVFIVIYGIVVGAVNILRMHRNRSVEPGMSCGNDSSRDRLEKDRHIWQTFVVKEVHRCDAGSSQSDVLSKEHDNVQKDTVSDGRGDSTAKKQPVDGPFPSSRKAGTTQDDGSTQAKQCFQTVTDREEVERSPLAECHKTSPAMSVRHTSSFSEGILAFALIECLQVSQAKEDLQPSVHSVFQRSVDKGLRTSTASECLQISQAVEGLQTTAAIEGLEVSASLEGLQTTAAIEVLETYPAIEGLQTTSATEGLEISSAKEDFQTSAAIEGFHISKSMKGLQKSAAIDGLRTYAARDFQARKGLQIFTANKDFQPYTDKEFSNTSVREAPSAIEGYQTSTSPELFQTSTSPELFQTSTFSESFQASTNLEGFRTPPASEGHTAFSAAEVRQISSDDGFPQTSGGTDDLLIPPASKYLQAVVSNY